MAGVFLDNAKNRGTYKMLPLCRLHSGWEETKPNQVTTLIKKIKTGGTKGYLKNAS